VILVLADDFGWGDLGGPGGMPTEVPNLDRMAKGGVRFTRFYVASPICSPPTGPGPSCTTSPMAPGRPGTSPPTGPMSPGA